jgi:hypothetical protein
MSISNLFSASSAGLSYFPDKSGKSGRETELEMSNRSIAAYFEVN